MKNKHLIILKVICLFVFFFCIHQPFVFAKELIEVTAVEMTDSTDTIDINDITVEDNKIVTSINFQQLQDYVTYEITIKNNSDKDYEIQSFINPMEKYISIKSQSIGLKIPKGKSQKIDMSLIYDDELQNEDSFVYENKSIEIVLSEKSFFNPKTSRYSILILFILFFLPIMIFAIRKKKYIMLLVMLLTPTIVLAETSINVIIPIQFNNIVVTGRYLDYTISFYDGEEVADTSTITYGESLNNLPVLQKDGYTFDGWYDENNHQVEGIHSIKEDVSLYAKFTPIVYSITYVLNGGTVSSANPTSYTVEDEFVLKNPTKSGYSFSGWREGSDTTLQTSVTIYKGTTGNKTYTAVFSTVASVPYTVIHRQMNLNGNYQEKERETLYGTPNTSVSPQPKTYIGFTSPEAQTKTINSNGSTTFTYDYERNKYTLYYSNTSRVNSTSTRPGTYYYETSITISCVSSYSYEEGFDTIMCRFDELVSNNSSVLSFSSPYTFTLTGNMTVSCLYECINTGCLSGDMEVEVYDKKKKKKKKKKLKDVNFDDLILCWNFDTGEFEYIEASFILKPTIAYKHVLLHFSDGSVLDVIGEHRMFNLDQNMFTHALSNEETPIGTKTINSKGEIIELLSKEEVHSPVTVCTVVTRKNLNIYTNGILTSITAMSNLYPIQNMKYIKEERNDIFESDLGVDEYVFKELRFNEVPKNLKGDIEKTKYYLKQVADVAISDDYMRNTK